MKPFTRPSLIAVLSVSTVLAGCSAAERLSRVGQAPVMSPVSSPTQESGYRPVSMPMPNPTMLEPAANSLWRPGARAFFKDQRAKEVGDVMTVVVNIQNERAQINNETRRTRDNVSERGAITDFSNILGGATPDLPSFNANSGSDYRGRGSINRDETISVRLAAVVLQTLPNGNLAIAGRQEVRVNSELREIKVAGVIRPEDIKSDNTIAADKIAEARISYGGRGTVTDVQQPRYGQQIFDVIFPF
ncbi:MAG: flagellar basal body L-ring protein FlgH [Alphaproteobacteria bacterium]|nr:flagellar basal body L-ring protein FlgH [Alphaproteobacteria bacterium]